VRRLRLLALGAALAYFFDPDNGTKRRNAARKRLAELRSQRRPELADDLVGQARGAQSEAPQPD
jgi:hypothetical protein